jgi:isoleucyl-tRNA synthetase
LNVKEVLFGKENILDQTITSELKQEGQYRELLRAVQALRKKKDLDPSTFVTLTIDGDSVKDILQIFEYDLKRSAQVEKIIYGNIEEGDDVDLDDYTVKISI